MLKRSPTDVPLSSMVERNFGDVGFVNLPAWREEFIDIVRSSGADALLQAPVLGRESADRPWRCLDAEEFYSVVGCGIHFPDGAGVARWPGKVLSLDPELTIRRLHAGGGPTTGVRAAIGGTFPLLDLVRDGHYQAAPLRLLTINDGVAGTILEIMEAQHLSLAEALQESQWQNKVPGNPALHLHGLVSRQRLALLGSFVFRTLLPVDEITVEGINSLDSLDVRLAARFGYSIRLLGVIERHATGLAGWVAPCLVPLRYMLAQVRGNMEMAYLHVGDGTSQIFSGPATSSLVAVRGLLRDLEIGRTGDLSCFSVDSPVPAIVPSGTDAPMSAVALAPSAPTLSNETRIGYYLRFSMLDFTRTLAQVASILAESGVDISLVHQPEETWCPNGGCPSGQTVVLFSTPTTEKTLFAALARIRTDVRLATVHTCLRHEG